MITLLFSISLLITAVYGFKRFVPSWVDALPFVGIIPVAVLLIIHKLLIKDLRHTFFENNSSIKIVIDTYLNFFWTFFIMTILLSDVPLVIDFFSKEDLTLMSNWVIGFVIFVAVMALNMLKDINLFKLETGMKFDEKIN